MSIPFKYLFNIGKETKIFVLVICKLCSRWDTQIIGFTITTIIVSLTQLDVCLILRLSIVGDKVCFEEDV